MSKIAKVEIFKDAGHEWRWRALARNGEPIASSGEGYEHRHHSIDMATDLHPDVEIVVIERG